MKIPEIQAELHRIAAERDLPEIAVLANELSRRKPVMKTRPRSRHVTEEVREEIRAFRRSNPGMSQAEIGRRFNVNAGRVSEALAGFRE